MYVTPGGLFFPAFAVFPALVIFVGKCFFLSSIFVISILGGCRARFFSQGQSSIQNHLCHRRRVHRTVLCGKSLHTLSVSLCSLQCSALLRVANRHVLALLCPRHMRGGAVIEFGSLGSHGSVGVSQPCNRAWLPRPSRPRPACVSWESRLCMPRALPRPLAE